MKLRVLDLFSGIGGFSLGLERTGGFETVAFCEIEEFPRKVLAKHWPSVPIYEDVRMLNGERLSSDGITVDVITGGFPCQDISTAGRQAGINDGTRSGLWSEIARLAREVRPKFLIVENVANLLAGPSEQPGGWFGRVLGDLAEIGFDAEWHCIPASAIGAPHRRDRVWIVAHPTGKGLDIGVRQSRVYSEAQSTQGGETSVVGGASWRWKDYLADSIGGRCEGSRSSGFTSDTEAQGKEEAVEPFDGCFGHIWRTEPAVGRVANGVPHRVDRLKALGNAVVPQIPEMIGRAILQSMKEAA